MKTSKGFTLLELLVVIGIIAILVTLGIASYSTAQKKARDAKRQSDLVSFQSAIEQCYSVNSFVYPIISGNNSLTITETCPPATGGPSMTIVDPSAQKYTVASTTTTYSVTTTLESGPTFTISQQQ